MQWQKWFRLAQADAVHNYQVGVAEETVLTLTNLTGIDRVHDIAIDLANFTPGRQITWRLYERIDNNNYRHLAPDGPDVVIVGTSGNAKHIHIESTKSLFLTIQINVPEAGIIACPYYYRTRDL